ncbi:MAG TPA: hypothetical protein VFE25_10355 [Opitutaceae bacterium]|jgi:hypothetical protein|nr:hypothetical protein [Opitutaceae bacterium]
MTTTRVLPVAALLVLLLQACASRQGQGTSAVEMLEPIRDPQPKTDKKGEATMSDVLVNPIGPESKGELARPVYPPAALAGHAGRYVVNATILIDTNGVVTEVRPTWQRMNIPGPYSDLFFAAAKAAISTWRFEPARNVYWRKNGDADPLYLYAEAIEARTDVRFTFDSNGKVH